MLSEASRAIDFPSLVGRSYLNTAAEGVPPRQVIRALAQYGEDKLLGMDGRALHEAQWDLAKRRLSGLLGLSAEEITLCSSSSEAFNLARLALSLKDGDEVIVTDLDFPAGVTPFMLPESAANVRVWRSRSDGALYVEDLAKLLSPRTKFVQVSLVSFLNGFRLELKPVAAVIRASSDALLGVDVTQAFCRVAMDLSDADLIVSSTHKWLLASHGGGIVGIPARSAGRLTARAGGWFNLENAFAADRFERPAAPKAGAAGFTVGMPNYPAVYAIAAAADYIAGIGVATIEDYARPLIEALYRELKAMAAVEVITPSPSVAPLAGIVAFRHPDSERIAQHLRAANVHIMHNAGRLRVAVHGYNTPADVEAFLRAMRAAVGRG